MLGYKPQGPRRGDGREQCLRDAAGELQRAEVSGWPGAEAHGADGGANAPAQFEEEATKRKFGAANRQPPAEDKIDDMYGVTVIDDYLFDGDNEAIKKVSAATCFLRVLSSDGR